MPPKSASSVARARSRSSARATPDFDPADVSLQTAPCPRRLDNVHLHEPDADPGNDSLMSLILTAWPSLFFSSKRNTSFAGEVLPEVVEARGRYTTLPTSIGSRATLRLRLLMGDFSMPGRASAHSARSGRPVTHATGPLHATGRFRVEPVPHLVLHRVGLILVFADADDHRGRSVA